MARYGIVFTLLLLLVLTPPAESATSTPTLMVTTEGTTTDADVTTTTVNESTPPDIVVTTVDGPTSPTTASTTSAPHGDDEYDEVSVEYPPFDGWYNNWAHPDWGGAETPLFRRIHPAYGDGAYEPSGANRPNPIDISDAVFSGVTGHPSIRNRTALLVFFGQQVVEEILDAQRPGCPPEYFNIEIPKGHPQYDKDGRGGRIMPLLRSRYDQNTGLSPSVPREQLNEISAYLDGGLTYGPNKAWADAIRSYKRGRLAGLNDSNENAYDFPALNKIRLPLANPGPPFDHPELKPISRFFMLGNPRGNENPFLLTFGVLWYRYHNLIAERVYAAHNDWSDERIYQEARKHVIAVHQKIVVYDWLPVWLNATLEPYEKYDPTIHPGIAHIFQSAAMRFGHTLVPPGVYRMAKNCSVRETTTIGGYAGHKALRVCNTYWNSPDVINETDIDELLMGMAHQITEREDNIITNDLKGDVFGALEFPRRDLMAVNIQRGRDHGLPDYQTTRKLIGLKPRETWEEINPAFFNTSEGQEVLAKVKELYNNSMDDLDLWPAGMLETTEAGPGETFRTIIRDQFRRIRDGDRFWYENAENGLYTEEEVKEIKQVTLRDIILAVTDLEEEDLPQDIFMFDGTSNCAVLPQLNGTESNEGLSECKRPELQDFGGYFDYFSGSEISYALSFFFLLAFFFAVVGLLICLARLHDNEVKKKISESRAKKTMKQKKRETKDGDTVIHATEWVGKKQGNRSVVVELNSEKKHIIVKESSSPRAKVFRTIDLSLMAKNEEQNVDVVVSADGKKNLMSLKVPKEYDLVLVFKNEGSRNRAQVRLEQFIFGIGLGRSLLQWNKKMFLTEMETSEDRDKIVQSFLASVMQRAFEKDTSKSRRDTLNFQEAREILQTELTRHEFADALSLKADSLFVDSMFRMVDKNQNGYISFREFLDFFVIFAKGDAEAKARLMFDMYDLDQTGTLSRDEFKTMLKSMVELANETIDEGSIQKLIDRMFTEAGLQDKSDVTFDDFRRILKDYETQLNYAHLNVSGMDAMSGGAGGAGGLSSRSRARQTILTLYGDDNVPTSVDNRRFSMSTPATSTTFQKQPEGKFQIFLHDVHRIFVNNKQQIFWATLYTLVSIGIFVERAYYYSVEREHGGLRRIAGFGVSITRGAASGMMFTYSCLLVTMCRNTITFLRETFLHNYIPFDSAIDMHKYIAFLGLVFTIFHIIGHMINFYHVATQTAGDLLCLFRNYFYPTDYLPKFHFWCWQTLTGFTGVLLVINLYFIYVFAIQYARRHAFKAFWMTHNTYPIFFILMLLHGAGRLVQPPFFHYFMLGPTILFTIDRLISVSRKKVEISVVKAELLPSDVTLLEFKRPNDFDYKSGQWVRIACLVQGENEYHPFTLSSAPHEKNLTLHIRAVGPWTFNLRKTYNPELVGEHSWPSLYLDGPYGEGHQDWYRFPVSILVGGGIGVTPFASILKDIANRSATDKSINCRKVYFLWVTRTQRQFEWMTDIIREVEESSLVSVHIFITQFKEKFDIRTTMLYICERHFQKYSERSLFTGLRSITHFGRPDFKNFFSLLKDAHPDVDEFGVFSCGPPPMTGTVEKACINLNNDGSDRFFVHHFENF